MKRYPEAQLLGIKVSLLDTKGLLDAIRDMLESRQRSVIASGNIHSFNLARNDPVLKEFLNRSEIVRLDGAGIALGARILGYHPPRRSTWADFGWALARLCSEQGFRLFLFGGRPEVAGAAARKLQERYPALQIAGTQHGYVDLSGPSTGTGEVIETINASGADILIVGLGMPKQELWLVENREKIDVPVVMTGGAVFDYLSGATRRAPRWMLDHGLEWLFRLMMEPRRMWKRYVVGNPAFLVRVVRQRFSGGRAPGRVQQG